jgi:hypothetical protein
MGPMVGSVPHCWARLLPSSVVGGGVEGACEERLMLVLAETAVEGTANLYKIEG